MAPIWNKIEIHISAITEGRLTLSEQQTLFGVKASEISATHYDKVNHLLLVAKMCINQVQI